ncbi:Ttll5 [Symbiodinium sp. CCMP2456]|nr:Ttll5 [Symbiodinium sp. CCMP2456]
MDDLEDVMDGAPSDEDFEPPQPRGPVRSRRPPTRKPPEQQEGSEVVPTGPKPRKITLLKSVFEGRPPVVLFSYTQACCADQRPMDRAVPADEEGPRMFYSHTDAIHQYNAVINILRYGGLFRVRAETNRWTVLWSLHPTPDQLRRFSPVQRANHFPGSFHLGRKDLIWRNLAKMQQRFGKEYQITPQGYILPKAFLAWDAARLRQPEALWIWKPCSQSCGRGIMVFSSDVPKDQMKEMSKKRGIIQRYIPNPLLIGGRKFDMRIYVVVLSYDPLKVYVNDEGLVRFATEQYSEAVDTLQSRMMHLTNYSVNKQNPDFVQNLDGQGEDKEDAAVDDSGQPKASKWSLKELQIHFAREGLDFEAMWASMKDLVIKTLISVEEPLKAEWVKTTGCEDGGWSARGPGGAHRGSCFEIYGFDVLVDRSLKPWLLEVNICPSLSSGSPLDKRIKTKLVADVLTLVGVHPPTALWKLSRALGEGTSSTLIASVACSAMHDSETSPLGRLDEYIRSFEQKYGAVPVELQTHDLQSSVGSFVEPLALRPSREEKPDPPPDGLRNVQSSPARELSSLPARTTTPRYPWQVAPSEPVRALPFKLRTKGLEAFAPHVQATAPSTSYKVPSGFGSDLSTACGSSSLGLGMKPSEADPPMPDKSATALDISSMDLSHMSMPPLFERSSMFNPVPEWDSSRVSQRSFSQAPAPLPQSSFCSLAARSSFVTDAATSSSFCFAPGELARHRGDPGLAPCARLQRARAASNPPKLQLAGPSGRHRVARNAPRPSSPNLGSPGSHRPRMGNSPCRASSQDPFAPLPAPREAMPKAQKAEGQGSGPLESGPPQLSPPRKKSAGSAGPLPSRASKSLKDAAVQFEHGARSAAREAQDEVNCQSPKVPQAFAARSCEIAVQTDSMAAADSDAAPRPRVEPIAAVLHLPETPFQTNGKVEKCKDEPSRDNGLWNSMSPLSQISAPRRELAEGVSLSQDDLTQMSALCTPEKLWFSAMKDDTPDFGGDIASARASSLWQGSFNTRPVPACGLSMEHDVAQRLDGPCGRLASSPSAEMPHTNAEMEQLNQQLLRALARAMTHLRRMQSLSLPTSWNTQDA